MVKMKIKRAVSFVMATVLSLSAFMSIGTSTAFAASGEKTNVYMVDFLVTATQIMTVCGDTVTLL